MLYLIHGSDSEKARGKARELIDSLRKKKPEAEMFRLTEENWSEAALEELIGGQGLFERKFIIFADNLLKRVETAEKILDFLKVVADSENVFIFLESSLTVPVLKKFDKVGAKTQIFSKEKEIKKEFNIFGLTDALGRRDRKGLWVLYQKALANGSVPEEIHGLLFWQAKSMMAAALVSSAAASGLNPFVFKKASGFSKNFKPAELSGLVKNLVSIYHDSRLGGPELEIALEQFVLKI